ncbi:hypothetical protein FHS82_002413 [Pseudochelatococcus lubricantis]|uniref:Uncharacterized protein n=1 Tax=Pseudochelatococcus lubricantis TaxID=1538102 RepID=A0ABX0V2J1_9HYPH|nr:hypothetical protein [Pseudochelatococcus lubricantis]NIJ58565.1 hypothetical protein [Pseudochelatococcus lubricantis]
MINNKLREFIDKAYDDRAITEWDVRTLLRHILPDGIANREEANALIALDRLVPKPCNAWGDALIALLVDYVVWAERPTGIVRGDDAHWLVSSLGAAGGPTRTALRAAHEIVREAQEVDGILLNFILTSQRLLDTDEVVLELPARRRAHAA